MAAAFFAELLSRSGRWQERSLLHDVAIFRAGECEPAAMERRKRCAMTDRDDRRLRKSLIKELIERRFAWFVQRSCRFIEKQEIGTVKKCARDAEPLLLALRQHPVPVRFLLDARHERRQADGADELRDRCRVELSGLGRIRHCCGERRDRES